MITLSINRLSYAIFMLFSAYFDSDFTIQKQEKGPSPLYVEINNVCFLIGAWILPFVPELAISPVPINYVLCSQY